MMKKIFLLLFLLGLQFSCRDQRKGEVSGMPEMKIETAVFPSPEFGQHQAANLLELPLKCYNQEYPYKPGQTLESTSDLKEPSQLHPVFYGCFDWHSAVHSYWSMIALIKKFPQLERAEEVKTILRNNFTRENFALELAYFEREINLSFERTYGWSWFLKLAEELHTWEDPLAKELQLNMQPLTDLIVQRYKGFLPKLVYPIRVGEHTNTAFGLSFAYDYALTTGEKELAELISLSARNFYLKDKNCPIDWEPGGFDFLSPCFEEITLMRRVLEKDEFLQWVADFMPQLHNKNYKLEVGRVSDRTDGKLVHLDGLNFSRAWSLYALANQYQEFDHLRNSANEHMEYSLPNLVDDEYEGGHWLGSFAIYALLVNEEYIQ